MSSKYQGSVIKNVGRAIVVAGAGLALLLSANGVQAGGSSIPEMETEKECNEYWATACCELNGLWYGVGSQTRSSSFAGECENDPAGGSTGVWMRDGQIVRPPVKVNIKNNTRVSVAEKVPTELSSLPPALPEKIGSSRR